MGRGCSDIRGDGGDAIWLLPQDFCDATFLLLSFHEMRVEYFQDREPGRSRGSLQGGAAAAKTDPAVGA